MVGGEILIDVLNLFFKHVKVVDNNSDEEIKREERAADDKDYEVNVGIKIRFSSRLQVDASAVNSIGHDFHPPFERCYLKERQITHADMVKVNFRVNPRVI